MTIKKLALASALALILTANISYAKPTNYQSCDTYCGLRGGGLETPRKKARHSTFKKARYAHKRSAHKRKWTRRYAARSVPVSVTTGASSIVYEARQHLGKGAVFGRSNLWCARFMNYVLERTGKKGTGSDLARSFASYGTRISGPQVGAIAVMSRGRRGGHVGIVSGIDRNGNPIIISGNHRKRVAESVYPRRRIYAYVMP